MPEHLLPFQSPYNVAPTIAEYNLAVANILVYPHDSDWPVVSLVNCFSTGPEWSLIIDQLDDTKYLATVREADEQIWGAKNWSEATATSRSLQIDREIAEPFAEACVVLLRGVRHPDLDSVLEIIAEGASYYFFIRDAEVGLLSGTTWSPPPGSPPAKLVSFSHAMYEYVTKGEEQDSLLLEMEKLIHWFRSQKLIAK